MLLRWDLHQNPVLGNGEMMLPLSDAFAVTQASFGTGATGGFLDGRISLRDVPKSVVMDAVESNWLMTELRAWDAQGYRAYGGFVAEIEGVWGGQKFVRRLDPMFNRVRIHFWMPSGGKRVKAVRIVEDAASQARYGIKETLLDLSSERTMYEAAALNRGNEFLETVKVPQSFELEMSAARRGENGTLTLVTWGRWATLKWRIINMPVRTARELKEILHRAGTNKSLFTLSGGAVVQFVNQSDLTGLKTTGILATSNLSTSLTTVQEVIAAITKFGDANLRRAYFQIWENGQPFLAVRDVEAHYYTRSDDGRAWALNHTPVPPYMVRADGYLLIEDYATALGDYSADVATDPRAVFVNATTYDDIAESVKPREPQRDDLPLLLGQVREGKRYVDA